MRMVRKLLTIMLLALAILQVAAPASKALAGSPQTVITMHVDFSSTCPGTSVPSSCYSRYTYTETLVNGVRNYYLLHTDDFGEVAFTIPETSGLLYWWTQPDFALADRWTIDLTGGDRDIYAYALGGDADSNNVVNNQDFIIFKNSFGYGCGGAGFDTRADFNRDCVVNTVDFNILKANYGVGGLPQW